MDVGLILIINADDFGISPQVNKVILNDFKNGLITSTTLLANMPGFEDAVNIANANSFLKNKIGLHLNLTEGPALSEPIKKFRRFCNSDGEFIYDRRTSIFFMPAAEKKAVYTELKAQISRLIDHNIYPTHIDSHHHVHTEFGIAKIWLDIAKEYGIKKIRLSKNIGKMSYGKKIYKYLFNTYVRKIGGFSTTDYFCTTEEFKSLLDNKTVLLNRSYEVMAPKYNNNGELVNATIIDIINNPNLQLMRHELTNYSEL